MPSGTASIKIEYPDERPDVRARFERELAERDLRSVMPEEAYRSSVDAWAAP